jgi:hypothetical protein
VSTIQFTDRGAAVRVSGESGVLARAAMAARKAPSILNSQPWRWRVDGRVLELRANRSRQIATRDPDARMLTLSCGAALHHARITLAAEGVRIRVEYLPDPTQPDLLATVTHLGLDGTPDPENLRAYRAIAARHSDRRAFAAEPAPNWALDQLRAVAARAGAHLHVMSGRGVASLSSAAGVVQAESADTGARYAMISTAEDDRYDWLAAGEALSAVLLTATADGLATSVSSGVVENPETRALLRRALRTAGHPAVVVRIGLPAGGPAPRPAARRPGRDTVEIVVWPIGKPRHGKPIPAPEVTFDPALVR